MQEFHDLRVSDIVRDTHDTVVISLELPEDLLEQFSYHSGQYLTISQKIKDEEVRRSYSICTAPHQKELKVAVKKIPQGKMSTFLNEHLNSGDTLAASFPQGKFVVNPDHQARREHYFFATGSGITPIIAMIKDILENEAMSTCYLYYGSRDENNIIFHNEINTLLTRHKDQFHCIHTLSKPVSHRSKGIKGMLGFKDVSWKGETGRIDLPKLINFFEIYPPTTREQHYYMCGAGEMIATCVAFLEEKGISNSNIHTEYFTPPVTDKKEVNNAVDAAALTAMIGDDIHQVTVDQDKTILEALLENKVSAPYSCTSGACSSCIARVLEGSAEMEVSLALDDDEIADGYILTCQAHPTSEKIVIRYNDLEI